MKNVIQHTINLVSWINTRNELTSLDGAFTPTMIKGEGNEFSFIMANYEDPELIKEALLEIIQDMKDSITGFAETIAKENKLISFLQNVAYRTEDVVSILNVLPDQQFDIVLKERV